MQRLSLNNNIFNPDLTIMMEYNPPREEESGYFRVVQEIKNKIESESLTSPFLLRMENINTSSLFSEVGFSIIMVNLKIYLSLSGLSRKKIIPPHRNETQIIFYPINISATKMSSFLDFLWKILS